MATVYGVNADKQFVDTPSTKIDASAYRGRLRRCSDTYEAAASTAGTIIRMIRLNAGDVIDSLTTLRTDALGTGVTADIVFDPEDGTTDVELATNIDVSSASSTQMNAAAYIATFPYTCLKSGWLCVETADAAATGTILLDAVTIEN